MTVIREKQNYKYPKPNSTTASDTESLHLGSVSASDNESLNEEPHSVNRRNVYRPPVRISQLEELVNIKKSSGKKKLRRYQNRCVLHTLDEEDENENIIVIMESYKSPFARLLEDPNALEYWNSFIEKSEEEQSRIVRAFSEKFYVDHDDLQGLEKKTVQGLEEDLIEFFKATPQDTYVKFPPTSFDRLLLHAVAQYHKLKSLSVLVETEGKRSVEVRNTHAEWSPADRFLTDFIKDLRR